MGANNPFARLPGCYAQLNAEWKKTAKILFGREVGELAEFEKWLLGLKQPMARRFSSLSGGDVALASPDYPREARIASYEEAMGESPFTPLDINRIKDVDSLMEACRAQIIYSGNIVLGNSSYVEGSSSVSDSFYVYNSARVHCSKYVGCSTIAKFCESLFGCNVTSFSNCAVRCHQQGKGVRNFEVNLGWLSSDCYYSYNVTGCADCMFCFNMRSKRHAIGNLALPREKYLSIKRGLLEQIAGEIETKKSAPTLAEIICGCGPVSAGQKSSLAKFARREQETFDMGPVEEAFAATSKIVLGRPLRGIEGYAPWLGTHTICVGQCESAAGSGTMPLPAYENFKALPKERFVNFTEAGLLGEILKISGEDAGKLDLSSAPALLSGIAFPSAQDRDGPIANVGGSPIVINSSNCCRVHGCVNLKNSAYSTWPNGSDHVFGCAFALDSGFSLKCYSSAGLKGCFELDSSSGSAYSYFCHNVENVRDSMFCFNAKNLTNAVWNQPVGRENYMKLKGMLQDWMLEKLEKDKTLGPDIFSLAQGARSTRP